MVGLFLIVFFLLLICLGYFIFYFFDSVHDVLQKGAFLFSNVVLRCRGGFCRTSPMIRSRAFSEPVSLECDVHVSQCLTLTRRLRMAGVFRSPLFPYSHL